MKPHDSLGMAPTWHKCPTHGPAVKNAWGCPDCVREMRGQRGVFIALLKEADAVLSTIEPDDTHEAGLLAQLRRDIAKAIAAEVGQREKG